MAAMARRTFAGVILKGAPPVRPRALFHLSPSIPTLIVFKDGKPVNKLIGGQPKPQLKAFVEGAF